MQRGAGPSPVLCWVGSSRSSCACGGRGGGKRRSQSSPVLWAELRRKGRVWPLQAEEQLEAHPMASGSRRRGTAG